MKTLIKALPFDIAARLPLQLGRESIASSTAAIAELIKNSYDANAELVSISFLKPDAPAPILHIEDDGDGMDMTTLENSWLKIGTEFKAETERSKRKGRVLTGAKGLGRLGIDRLCRKLILQTKTENSDEVLELQIDWKKYNSKNATIGGVTHKIFKLKAPADNKYSNLFKIKGKGTRLTLIGLKEKWSKERLSELKNELSLLVSPFSKVNDFSIELNAKHDGISGLLTSEHVLSEAVWSVQARLDDQFKVHLTFTHNPSGERIEQNNLIWNEWLKDRDSHPHCGPLSFDFYYMPQHESGISLGLNRKAWSDFMSLHHGVKIYRDNFRVRPYGEPSGRGDWLDFGLRKASNPSGIRQGNWKVGPKQILGAVFISRIANPDLLDQANREGMVESVGYFDLRAFALKVISIFEATATEHARKNAPPPENFVVTTQELNDSIERSRLAVAELSSLAAEPGKTQIDESVRERLAAVEALVEKTKEASERQERAFSAHKLEIEREKDTLANLASLGILTVCFGHEVKEFCTFAAASAEMLKEEFQGGAFMLTPDAGYQFIGDIGTIIDSTKFINDFAAFSIGNVRKDKRQRRAINISIVAKRVFDALSVSLTRQNIEWTVDIEEDMVPVSGYEIDWESIFVNLISNSIWAMTQTPKGSRFIKVIGRNHSDQAEIRFFDSGCGIELGSENHIFNAMYSTRRDEKGNVIGTGMGLSIVKTFVVEHASGEISVLPRGQQGGRRVYNYYSCEKIMRVNIAYIDEETRALDIFGRRLSKCFGGEANVIGLAPELNLNDMIEKIMSIENLRSLIVDQKLTAAGTAKYIGTELAEAIRSLDKKLPVYILTNYAGDVDSSDKNIEYVLSKTDLVSTDKIASIAARLRRHIDIFDDICTEREKRFEEILRKSQLEKLSDDEISEYGELSFYRSKQVIAAELINAHELEKRAEAAEEMLNNIYSTLHGRRV